MSAPAAPPAHAPVAEPGAQCNRSKKAEVLRFELHDVNQGAVHTFMAPTQGTVKLSGGWAVKLGSLPKPSGPRTILFPPACSIRGNVKRKYFSLELKCAEDWSRHSAPLTRFCPVRCDVIVRGRLRPGMRVGCDPGRIFLISAPGRSVVRGGSWFVLSAFPSWEEAFFRTARSGQGRAV